MDTLIKIVAITTSLFSLVIGLSLLVAGSDANTLAIGLGSTSVGLLGLDSATSGGE